MLSLLYMDDQYGVTSCGVERERMEDEAKNGYLMQKIIRMMKWRLLSCRSDRKWVDEERKMRMEMMYERKTDRQFRRSPGVQSKECV